MNWLALGLYVMGMFVHEVCMNTQDTSYHRVYRWHVRLLVALLWAPLWLFVFVTGTYTGLRNSVKTTRK